MKTHTLVARSPAKINLFLHIVGKRTDNYHLLESIFCPVGLSDHIEIALTPRTDPRIQITRTGDLLHIPQDNDLTVKACLEFFRHTHMPHGWNITLHVNKNIPEQAGLGGGSSNAASTLKLLQQHFNNPIAPHTLHTLAQQLGADVPFFLLGKTAFVEGIGEQITPLTGVKAPLLILKPPISCSTAQIFSDSQLTRDSKSVRIAVFDSVKRTESSANNNLNNANTHLLSFIRSKTCNALQQVVESRENDWGAYFRQFSETVAQANPLLVRMTGSGSAMFAVFASPSQCSNAVKAVYSHPVLKQSQWFETHIE